MKIFKNGITQDSETGQIYQVGRSADAVDAPVESTPTPPKTTSDLYGDINFETPEEKAFRESQALADKTAATEVIDENAIRSGTLTKFQAEIDALNKVYAEKKAEEKIAGEGRLGENAAVSARRGLLGSDFGTSMQRKEEFQNVEKLGTIENERLAKEQDILTRARQDADTEISNKKAAKTLGTDNYLKYIREQSTKRKQTAENYVKQIYDAGTETVTRWDELANVLGISVENLKTMYSAYKKTTDASKVKESIKLSPGESIYNPNTGKNEYTAPVDEKPITMSPGSVLVDKTGKTLFTAPDKPTNPLDYIKEVGGYIYKYNPTTNTTTVTSAPREEKTVTINGETYIEKTDANGNKTYVKPTLPTAPSAEKVKKAQDVSAQINSLLNDPNLDKAIGTKVGALPTWALSNEQADVVAKINKLIAGIAIENLSMLKGPMSDKDIEFIKQASSGLTRQMSPEGFKARLTEIKNSFDNIANTYKSEGGTTQSLQEVYTNNPDKRKQIEQIKTNDPNLSDEEVLQIIGFNNVGSDTNSATLNKVVSKANGTKGGQCGTFVNNLTGLGLGDSFQSKMSKMDPTITYPEPGMVFTMPYKNTGHTGFIIAVNNDGTATVKDSNYNLNEKIQTHKIKLDKMTGFRRV